MTTEKPLKGAFRFYICIHVVTVSSLIKHFDNIILKNFLYSVLKLRYNELIKTTNPEQQNEQLPNRRRNQGY